MKLKLLQKYMKKEKVDLVILLNPDIAIDYFTQNKFSYSILIVKQKSAELYISPLDKKPKLNGLKVDFIKKSWEKSLFSNKIKTIGVNKEVLTLASFERIKKIFKKNKPKYIDISKELSELRSTKTDEEIKKIKKACNITDYAFDELVKSLKKQKNILSLTEKDVANFLEKKIQEKSGTLAFPTIVASGKNSSIPHHVTSGQKLKRGFLLLDYGARYDCYCSDMSRMLFIGEPKKEELDFYNLLLNAQISVLKEIKKDVKFSDLDKYVRKELGKYSSYFIHSLGHGVGIEIHEKPSFIVSPNNKVEDGQIFTIEPGIYFSNKFGIRIEDTLLFDGKVKLLTKSKKSLIVIKK